MKKGKSVISKLLQTIEKQCGKGSVICMGDNEVNRVSREEVIPTGSITLDLATGIMGYPRGKLVEIFGPESSGKTTLALHAIASVQSIGGIAAFIDAEHALDPVYAQSIGVKLDELLISQPDYGEQALEISELLIRSGCVDVIVIDSVAALVPRAEIEGEMGESHMGLQARLMSQAMRKLTAIAHKNRTCVVFINQIRQKIGVVFGNPETTTGGTALKFYASMRLDVRRKQAIKNGDVIEGSRVKVKLVKNKMAPPFKEAEFDIRFGVGIDGVGEVFDLCLQNGIIDRSGTWYSAEGERIGQGRENAICFLRENADVTEKLRGKLISSMGINFADGGRLEVA